MRMKKMILSAFACVAVLGSVTFSANAAPAQTNEGNQFHMAAVTYDDGGAASEVTYWGSIRKYAMCNAYAYSARWQYIDNKGDSKYLQSGGDTAIWCSISGGSHTKAAAYLYTSSSPYSTVQASVYAER